LAKEDLAGAKILFLNHNRNAVYLCSQAAEKMIRALLTYENIKAGIKHDLTEMIDKLSPEHFLKTELYQIDFLSKYATTFRYPTLVGRIPDIPSSEIIKDVLDKIENLLVKIETDFQCEFER
jgi:HEPN domain-containing protein